MGPIETEWIAFKNNIQQPMRPEEEKLYRMVYFAGACGLFYCFANIATIGDSVETWGKIKGELLAFFGETSNDRKTNSP